MGMTIDEGIKKLSQSAVVIGCEGWIEARDLALETMHKYQQLQANYENRLKADLVAMLTDIKLKIEELPTLTADSEDGQGTEPTYSCWEVENLIQEHINALKEASND